MASAMIGNLAVGLTLETAAFKRGATLAEKRAETLSARMKKVGDGVSAIGKGLAAGVVIGGLASIAQSAFDTASALTEAAAATGVSVEQLQRLRLAAEQNGGSADKMDASLARLSSTLGAAQTGSKQAVAAFEAIGISVDELKGKNAAEAFALITDRISKIKDPTMQAAAAKQIFGKSYADLLPLIKGGTAALDDATEASKRNGEISTEDAAKLDDLADRWDMLKTRVGVATANVIVATSDLATKMDEFLLRGQTAVGNFYKAVGQAVTNIQTGFTNMVSSINSAVNGFVNTMVNTGRDMILGLVRGISNNAAAVKDALFRTVSNSVERVKDYLGIRSPSRLMMGFGVNVVEGLAIGIDGSKGLVFTALDSVNQGLAVRGQAIIANSAKVAEGVEAENGKIATSFEDTAQSVLGSLSNLANSIKGGGFFDILGSLVNIGLQLGGAGAFGSDVQARLKAPGRARGGNTTSNRSYVVGERGPELFTPNRTGYITPNNQLGADSGRVSLNLKIVPSPYFDAVVDNRADSRVQRAAPAVAAAGAMQAQGMAARTARRSVR